jgi:hypothetical protein
MKRTRDPAGAEPAEHNERADRAAAFAALLEHGEYRALFGQHIDAIFAQAARQLEESGLGDEIGALRVVLARLMAEEQDIDRLALNVSRIVSVAVKVAQTQHALTGQSTEAMADELKRLIDLVEPPLPVKDIP